jgi:nicotinate phosphoribosyltransferase
MTFESHWVNDDNMALLTDLYELTMMQAYWEGGMSGEATFSLFPRRLPEGRNYLLACGLDSALAYLEKLRFTASALDYLRSLDELSEDFVDWLGGLRFTGSVSAVPEGTPIFANEPLLEVTAPIAEAQLAETFIMNQVHHQTVIASKAARIVTAAADRAVVDFGLRRMHGADAGVKAARAFHIAGVTATSDVLARCFWEEIPVAGTMAHSFVQAHDSELDAFRAFARLYPDTILLVDTYDTAAGVRKVVELAEEMGNDFQVRGVRLDSGDLAELAFDSRRILDAAGLEDVEIFASGGLDEHVISDIVEREAPISGFGVGTGIGVAEDAPALDIAYKLTAYDGRGRLKLSSGKRILPGRKQIFRVEEGGMAQHDVLAREGEEQAGRPLLIEVMADGKRSDAVVRDLDEIRAYASQQIGRLPPHVRAIAPADPPYRVEVSEELKRYRDEVASAVARWA